MGLWAVVLGYIEGSIVKISTLIMGYVLGAGTVLVLPSTLPASWGWGYSRPRLRGPRGSGESFCPPDPCVPSCPSGLGNGGGLDPWPPRKKAISQAITWPVLTLWRQRSKYSIFLPSGRKMSKSTCSHLRAFALTISPYLAHSSWGSLPGWPFLILWVSERLSLTTLSKEGPLCDSLSHGNLFASLPNTSHQQKLCRFFGCSHVHCLPPQLEWST